MFVVTLELSKAVKEAKEANRGTVKMEKKLAKKGEGVLCAWSITCFNAEI